MKLSLNIGNKLFENSTFPRTYRYGGTTMSSQLSRRGFLSGAAALTAVTTTAGTIVPKKADAYPGMIKVTDMNWKPFMDQYYDGAVRIVKGIRDTQIGHITRAMRKAYEIRKNGGTIYSDIVFGHYASLAQSKDRPGQPWILPQFDIGEPEETFDAMKPGDFLITHVTSEARKRAKERGVYVVGVTNNYYPFYKTPPEGLREDKMALPTTEEMSNMVIDSQVPWDNGLVDAPQITQFKLCPSTGIAACSVYWSCNASLAALIGSKGKDTGEEQARRFLDILLDRFERIQTDRPKISRVAKRWADMVLEQHPAFMVFGEQFRVSERRTGNPFVSDAVGAASGTMIGQHYSEDKLTSNDMVLICSLRSRQEQELEVARAAQRKGAYVAAVCPYATDGDSAGVRLFKEVDDAFNTYSEESEGVLDIKGFDKSICPTTGLTGLLIHWMLMAAWTDHMARRGEMPYYWMGYHEKGGQEYDQAVRPYFMKRGY